MAGIIATTTLVQPWARQPRTGRDVYLPVTVTPEPETPEPYQYKPHPYRTRHGNTPKGARLPAAR